MNIIGIDPGLSGAVARIKTNSVYVSDMPVYLDGKQKHVDAATLSQIIESEGLPDVAILERVHSMPRQGVATTFSFGRAVGVAMGVLGARRIPMVQVTPSQWKKHFGLIKKDKAASVAKATELYGDEHWKLKKHEGVAEAALIATWGLHQLTKE